MRAIARASSVEVRICGACGCSSRSVIGQLFMRSPSGSGADRLASTTRGEILGEGPRLTHLARVAPDAEYPWPTRPTALSPPHDEEHSGPGRTARSVRDL